MSEELLDEAARALREETSEAADGDATLARIVASLSGETMLDDAARALREETHGDATALDADAQATLDRLHATLEGESALPLVVSGRNAASRGHGAHRARALPWLAVAAAALLAAVLGGPTALAWWRGAMAAVREWTHAEAREGDGERGDRETHVTPPTPRTVVATTVPTPPAPSAPPVTRAHTRENVRVGADHGALADRAERALFEDAQHVHLGGGSANDAVAGWERYLVAYPDGRYAPEARYNRALALVRAGRLDDASEALRPIAAAGGYRAHEASALLDAIAARR